MWRVSNQKKKHNFNQRFLFFQGVANQKASRSSRVPTKTRWTSFLEVQLSARSSCSARPSSRPCPAPAPMPTPAAVPPVSTAMTPSLRTRPTHPIGRKLRRPWAVCRQEYKRRCHIMNATTTKKALHSINSKSSSCPHNHSYIFEHLPPHPRQ